MTTIVDVRARALRRRLVDVETRLLQEPARPNGFTAVVVAVARFRAGLFVGLGRARPHAAAEAHELAHLVAAAECRARTAAVRAGRLSVSVGRLARRAEVHGLEWLLVARGADEDPANQRARGPR